MKTEIDISSWKRKEHYEFFSIYEEPFFSISANVDCTEAYRKAKESKISFFLYYMHKSLIAINSIEELRCRIEKNKPVEYDLINGSSTVKNADELFAFAFFPYSPDFNLFYKNAKEAIAEVKTVKGLNIGENSSRNDVIHYSTIPWVSFTSIRHERCFSFPDSIPKITFGKFFDSGDKLLLPMTVDAHHGLVDGMHVGQYFELFQKLLNS